MRSLASLVLLLGASACASVPDLGDRPALRAPATLASAQAIPGEAGTWPADRWWTALGDPQLDALIDEGLANAPDIATAAARIAAAQALAQQAGAALRPNVSLDAQAGGTKQSENLGIPPEFVPQGVIDTGRITGAVSFDLDLWGRNRAALRAARGEAAAAAVDAAQARLLLTTGIAAAYADLDQLFRDRDVAAASLAVRAATARLTAQRVQAGVETRGAQSQAEARVPQARADLAAIDESIALTRNRLAALTGAGPDRGRAIARPQLTAPGERLPDDAGIGLVGRRPDIVAARLRAEAASERIRVARADFYPNISLSALVGLQSLGLGNLLSSGSTYGNGGVALTLPVFDSGRIEGRYRGARAEYDAAVARYNAALVTALREVADAVASRNAAALRLAELRRALASAEDASRVANLRYRAGLSNQLPVLTADDTLLGIRRAVADADARRLALDVALIRALGGGYRDLPTSTGAP